MLRLSHLADNEGVMINIKCIISSAVHHLGGSILIFKNKMCPALTCETIKMCNFRNICVNFINVLCY